MTFSSFFQQHNKVLKMIKEVVIENVGNSVLSIRSVGPNPILTLARKNSKTFPNMQIYNFYKRSCEGYRASGKLTVRLKDGSESDKSDKKMPVKNISDQAKQGQQNSTDVKKYQKKLAQFEKKLTTVVNDAPLKQKIEEKITAIKNRIKLLQKGN